MRILTRYILREVTSHALIGVGVFTFVLFTRDLGRILELVVRNSAPLPSVADIFFYTVPVALLYTIPMGVLVGILIGLRRLAADSEITPSAPRITLAQQGILVSEGTDTLHLHLTDGATHETDPKIPDQYQISTFKQTDIPILVPQAENKEDQASVPVAELGTRQLPVEAGRVKKYMARWYWIEFH